VIERIIAIARPSVVGPVTRIKMKRNMWPAIAIGKTETRGRICRLDCGQGCTGQYQRSKSELGEGFHVSSPPRLPSILLSLLAGA
jgi:hypothetical protein